VPSIQTFNDFMQATGPSYLTTADSVINEAVKNTYAFSRLLKGKTSEQTVQGGTEIRDVIMFDDSRTYGHYTPNDTFAWRNPQVSEYIRCPWRFHIDHMSWTEHEIALNSSGKDRAGVKVAYKRLKRLKEQRMWTSMTNGFEEDLWAQPSVQQMEDETGRLPYSLPYFITEMGRYINDTIGLRGQNPFLGTQVNNNATVMRINPQNEARWSNAVELYDTKSDRLTPVSANWAVDASVTLNASTVYNQSGSNRAGVTIPNLFAAFDLMMMRLKYEAPPSRQEYFEKDVLNRQMILTSRTGVQQYRNALRLANDTLVSYQDAAYANPAYAGIDVTYCSDLDTAAIFPASNQAVTQSLAGYNGATGANGFDDSASGRIRAFGSESGANTVVRAPRYFFVNGNYLTPIFHSERYFTTHDAMRHPNQPFTWVQPVDCWSNLFCNSRQRHGIVAPINTT